MAGRGRASTLPAWKVAQDNAEAQLHSGSSSNANEQNQSQSKPGQYDDLISNVSNNGNRDRSRGDSRDRRDNNYPPRRDRSRSRSVLLNRDIMTSSYQHLVSAFHNFYVL